MIIGIVGPAKKTVDSNFTPVAQILQEASDVIHTLARRSYPTRLGMDMPQLGAAKKANKQTLPKKSRG
jgi:hypothetical protein